MYDSLNYLKVSKPNDFIRDAPIFLYLRMDINLYGIRAYFCSCIQYM